MVPKSIIDAKTTNLFPSFKEVWQYRQLMYSLAWRDIRVKYAQTYVGLTWAFINPLFNLIVLSFVFGTVAEIETGEIPHVLFTIAGLSAWTYFSTLLGEAGNSIVSAQDMIKKIYFPRIIIPLSKALSGLIDFFITFIFLLALMVYFGHPPGPNIVWLPLFIILSIISGLAGGILISALSVRFRDFAFITPMILRIGLFATPIAYSISNVPEKYKLLYFLNPLVGIVEGFRWSLFGQGTLDFKMIFSILFIFILLISALLYFAKVEREIADIL